MRTRENFPADWANTQNSLGVTYQHRTRGDRADNIEKAIASFEQALTIFTQESEPLNWVYTQSKIGSAYVDRIHGDRSDNWRRRSRV